MGSNPGIVYWMDIFSHLFVVKICNVCLKRPKNKQIEAGVGPLKNIQYIIQPKCSLDEGLNIWESVLTYNCTFAMYRNGSRNCESRDGYLDTKHTSFLLIANVAKLLPNCRKLNQFRI